MGQDIWITHYGIKGVIVHYLKSAPKLMRKINNVLENGKRYKISNSQEKLQMAEKYVQPH